MRALLAKMKDLQRARILMIQIFLLRKSLRTGPVELPMSQSNVFGLTYDENETHPSKCRARLLCSLLNQIGGCTSKVYDDIEKYCITSLHIVIGCSTMENNLQQLSRFKIY